MLGAALAWAGTVRAQVATNLFTFDTSATTSWVDWGGELTSAWDNSQDHTGNGGGSMYWYIDVSVGTGVAPFNNFNGNPYWPGSPAQSIDLSTATNISFWVKWDTGTSTLGIDSFNDQDYASTPGWGTSGLDVALQINGVTGTWPHVGNTSFPRAASNGWVQVNIPLTPGAVANENLTTGLQFFKWSQTSVGQLGIFAFWIDDIQAEYPGAPPPPPTLSPLAPATQGLNIYDDGISGDRQNIATVVTNTGSDYNYSWIGSANPVTYSVNIAKAPAASYDGYQVQMMIIPGDNITETAPDWDEANALVLFIQVHTNGVIGQLRYKLNNANNNSYLYGGDTNVFGGSGSAVTNTIVAGYGGLLCSITNVSGFIGTWSVKISSSGNITLASPGGTNTGAFPAGDAAAFASPVSVFWGTQPDTAGYFQGMVLKNVAINGSANTLNVDLTQPLDSTKMALRASSSIYVFATPTNALYWLQWAPPNPNFTLKSAASLTGTWSAVQGPSYTVTNFVNTFDTSGSFINSGRNYNPPPIWIGYDFGDDSAATVTWAAGPTYDAGGNSGSGSAKFNWTWAGGSGNEAFTMDLFASAQDLTGGTLSFDIMIDPSSTAGTNADYGYLNVIARDGGYGWNPTSIGEGLLTAAGGSTGIWRHVSIPLGSGADASIRALTVQISNDGNINGTQTIYIDNLQLTKQNSGAPTLYDINAVNSTFITAPMLPSSGAGFFRLSNP